MFETLSRTLLFPDKASFEGLFDDIREFIVERLTVDFGEYPNLGVTDISLERLRMTVIAAFLAIIVASFVVTINRGVYGTLITRLNANRCHTPETAMTLKELGIEKNAAVRSALRAGSVYKGLVFCPAKDEYDVAAMRERIAAKESGAAAKRARKYKYDFERDKFYIPETESFTAERKFEKKGSRLPVAILVSIITAIALFGALILLPDVLTLIDNFIGIMSGL